MHAKARIRKGFRKLLKPRSSRRESALIIFDFARVSRLTPAGVRLKASVTPDFSLHAAVTQARGELFQIVFSIRPGLSQGVSSDPPVILQ